jgi:hypothetical protein
MSDLRLTPEQLEQQRRNIERDLHIKFWCIIPEIIVIIGAFFYWSAQYWGLVHGW